MMRKKNNKKTYVDTMSGGDYVRCRESCATAEVKVTDHLTRKLSKILSLM